MLEAGVADELGKPASKSHYPGPALQSLQDAAADDKIIRLNSQVNILLDMGPLRFDTKSIRWL